MSARVTVKKMMTSHWILTSMLVSTNCGDFQTHRTAYNSLLTILSVINSIHVNLKFGE